ncbi:MAG: GldG family protein, partial [Treponema sp.]|nr:GldG family protein [Treponema sp.]
MTKRQTMVTTAFALAILALCFLLSRQVWFRLDVTRDGINTISRVSRDLHLEIAEQAQITYFISERLRAMHPLPGEVEDFLREYVGFSRGRMRLSVVDPARAGMSAEVESLGIAPWQIPMMEQGSASILTVYSGITIEYLGDIAVMPLVVSLETLEYDLTSRIRALARGAPRAAGILLTDPRAWEENFRHLSAALEQAGYRTVFVAPGAEIPAGLSALIVIDGVETLDDLALFQIDRFIRGGGSALFAARAVGVDARGGMEARALYDRGLLAMLASYGAILSPEIVMDEAALVMRFQEIADDGSAQIRSAPNFQWIRAMPEYASLAHPLGAGFAGLDLYWANPITLAPPYGIRAEPLFTTTPAAWTMREPFFASPELAYMMERDAPQTALGRR